jgi:hypothetical protein
LVYPTLSLNQYRAAPRRGLQHRMNRRHDQRRRQYIRRLYLKHTIPSRVRSLQHRMNRRTVSVMRRSSCVREPQRLRDVREAPDEPMLLKSRRRFIRQFTFQRAVSQRLAECLGLFIPPPLTHLRVLDCVEMQRSSRHLEDHIQSIQVFNCSSLDLHMLSVCA